MSGHIRARKVARILIEKKGISLRKAIKQAGYSQSIADNPQKLTRSKTFQELLNKLLPDEYLVKKTRDMMRAKRTVFATMDGEFTDQRDVNDNEVQIRALDMAHKLKSNYAPQRIEVDDIRAKSDEELMAIINGGGDDAADTSPKTIKSSKSQTQTGGDPVSGEAPEGNGGDGTPESQ